MPCRSKSEAIEPDDDADLGLSICAGLVRAMGGEIGYRPGLGGVGNLFRVDLPLRALPYAREDQIEAPKPASSWEPPNRSLRILGVDDVASNGCWFAPSLKPTATRWCLRLPARRPSRSLRRTLLTSS